MHREVKRGEPKQWGLHANPPSARLRTPTTISHAHYTTQIQQAYRWRILRNSHDLMLPVPASSLGPMPCARTTQSLACDPSLTSLLKLSSRTTSDPIFKSAPFELSRFKS